MKKVAHWVWGDIFLPYALEKVTIFQGKAVVHGDKTDISQYLVVGNPGVVNYLGKAVVPP